MGDGANRAWRLVAPAVLVTAWGGNHFTPLLPLYRATDGYSALDVDLFFAAYIIGIVPGFLLSGPLSDRYGRKALLIAGLLLGIVASVILALGSAGSIAMIAGRLLAGAGVALAMVVGTTWIKELSADAVPAVRARRASLSITVGFGAGAAVSGVLAQWGPAPTLTPYAVHVAASLLCLIPLLRARESRAGAPRAGALFGDLRVPRAARARFYRVVLPAAVWVFAAPALAFAVGPSLVAGRTGGEQIAFATLLTVVTLGVGTAVQPFVPWIARRTRGYPLALGLCLIVAGSLVLAVDSRAQALWPTILAAIILGAAFGVCMVCGLVEIQAMASPENLAGMTAIYYCLTYVGFALPALLSALAPLAPYPLSLTVVAAACLACAVLVAAGIGRARRRAVAEGRSAP